MRGSSLRSDSHGSVIAISQNSIHLFERLGFSDAKKLPAFAEVHLSFNVTAEVGRSRSQISSHRTPRLPGKSEACGFKHLMIYVSRESIDPSETEAGIVGVGLRCRLRFRSRRHLARAAGSVETA